MYLKSLTLRGFKSFASATTLNFEPGVTCVVGPNGSGKSNVVDALSWVMGEQGAKSLRGGKMEDVIFAGTAARAPLGRAEVVLTIDNSDGALPIDYAEVTIARTMFRNGGSEYAINSQPARLLDVQDLLSDSGIGREMHVIVGQGQLDSILQATPEIRRGFIEEAAGVLKHRKRKEKALRKLEACEGNLNRLSDLIGEIRRQLKPLGRQAEVARRAAVIQAELRDAKARLLADDLAQANRALESDLADEQAMLQRRRALEESLEQARARELDAEEAVRHGVPALSSAQETWYSLAALRERVATTVSIARERMRHSDDPGELRTGRDPDELDREAAAVAAQEQELAAEVTAQAAAAGRGLGVRGGAGGGLPGGGPPAGGVGSGGGRPAGGAGPAHRAGELAAQPGRGGRGRDRPVDPGQRAGPGARRPGVPRVHRLGDQGGRSGRRRARDSTPSTRPRSRPWTPSRPSSASSGATNWPRLRSAPGSLLGSRRCTSD